MKKRTVVYIVLFFMLLLVGFFVFFNNGDAKKVEFPVAPPGFSVTGDVKEGEKLYRSSCVVCHGLKGDGKGMAGSALIPPPTNFINSEKMKEVSDWRLFSVIKNGGAAYGLSQSMTPYGSVFTEQQIKDMVIYLRTFLPSSQNAQE